MAKAVAQITIVDLTDITVGTSPPSSPILSQMWLDTSSNPSVLKSWDGTTWKIVNETKVGGRNLILNSDFSKDLNNWTILVTPGVTVDKTKLYDDSNSIRITRSGLTDDAWTGVQQGSIIPIVTAGVDITISYMYRCDNKSILDSTFGVGIKGKKSDGTNLSLFTYPTVSSANIIEGAWTKFSYTVRVTDAMITSGLVGLYVSPWLRKNGDVWMTRIKAEIGNVATDWTKAPEDIETVVEAHTTAITTIQGQITTLVQDTKITVNGTETKLKDDYSVTKQTVGSLTSTVSSLDTTVTGAGGLTSRMSAAETKITTGAITNTVTSSDIFKAYTQGTMLYSDPTFLTGANGINVYNNSGNGNVIHTLIPAPTDVPALGSQTCLEVKSIGSASPQLGGFYFANGTRAYAVFLTKIVAKIPTGYTINWNSNATGDGGSGTWLSSNSGTGAFAEYYCKVVCGTTGTFSSTNFFSFNGTPGTSAAPIKFIVAYATVFDITNAEGSSSRLSKAETKLTPEGFKAEVSKAVNNNLAVRYISDTMKGSSANTGNHWVEIQVIDTSGNNVALNNATVTASNVVDSGNQLSWIVNGNLDTTQYVGVTPANDGKSWVVVDLGKVYNNIAFVKIYHYYADGRIYKGIKTEVSADYVTWKTIFDSNTMGTYAETSAGKTINVNGNYVITSTVSVTDTGMRVDHSQSNSYTTLTATGFEVFNKSDNKSIANFGQNSTAYIRQLTVEQVISSNVLPVITYAVKDGNANWVWNCSQNGSGDMSGRDPSNCIRGLNNALDIITNGAHSKGIGYVLNGNVEIYIRGVIYENIYIKGMQGWGNFYLSYPSGVVQNGYVYLEACTKHIFLYGADNCYGNATMASILTNTNCITVDDCNMVNVFNLNLSPNWVRDVNWPGALSVINGSTVYAQGLDVFKAYVCYYVKSSLLGVWTSRGNTNGYTYVCENNGGMILQNECPVGENNPIVRYASWDSQQNLVSTNSRVSPPPYHDVTLERYYNGTNYVSTRNDSSYSGVLKQGYWYYYPPIWKGYVYFSTDALVQLQGAKSIQAVQVYLQRENSAHGNNTAVAVVLEDGTEIGYLNQGQDAWMNLPQWWIDRARNSGGNYICLWSSNCEKYAIYNLNARLYIRTTATVQG